MRNSSRRSWPQPKARKTDATSPQRCGLTRTPHRSKARSNASPERLAATVEALRQREISLLVPAHCTGVAAVARLWESFPGRCAAPGVGRRFAFER
jgi:hypothetical protein